MKKSRLLGALSACVLVLITTTTIAAVLPLEGRLALTPGGTDYQAYYDPNLGITWAANANISGVVDTWENQVTWAANLTIGGVTGWRLPTADETTFLLYDEGITAATPDPFINIQPPGTQVYSYWTSTDFLGPDAAYFMSFCLGFGDCGQGASPKFANYLAWPVRTGDVPIPAAHYLLVSGLLGLLGISRRKKAA